MASRGGNKEKSRSAKCWRLALIFAVASTTAVSGCRSDGAPERREVARPSAAAPRSASEFSGQNAWKHMRALNQVGARVAGTKGSQLGRKYIARALDAYAIRTFETKSRVMGPSSGDAIEVAHLTAEIPGRSKDVLLLAAHYDTPPAADAPTRVDPAASGPAFLLELARTLRAGPVPEYTIWLTWIDGDSLDLSASPSVDRNGAHLGTQSLVDEWSQKNQLARVRAAFFFGNVGGRDRTILRDIDSPRMYREIFWEVAHELGFENVFPPDSHYGVTNTGRSTLAQASLRSAVALENGRDRVPPPAASSGDPSEGRLRRPSDGFEAVGRVTLEVLVRTASKLRKIDRFAEAPLRAGRDESSPAMRAE